ncbi:MAG: c-type cytochrome [Ferruginibacter sp.]
MKISLFFVLAAIIVGCNNNAADNNSMNVEKPAAVSNTNGEELFKANCASCHKPNESYVGPALQGVASRWESKELLYAFVRNSQEVIARNAYAKKLYEEYKQSPMLPYPNLTDKDIDDILGYCENYKAE